MRNVSSQCKSNTTWMSWQLLQSKHKDAQGICHELFLSVDTNLRGIFHSNTKLGNEYQFPAPGPGGPRPRAKCATLVQTMQTGRPRVTPASQTDNKRHWLQGNETFSPYRTSLLFMKETLSKISTARCL